MNLNNVMLTHPTYLIEFSYTNYSTLPLPLRPLVPKGPISTRLIRVATCGDSWIFWVLAMFTTYHFYLWTRHLIKTLSWQIPSIQPHFLIQKYREIENIEVNHLILLDYVVDSTIHLCQFWNTTLSIIFNVICIIVSFTLFWGVC